ncbi:Receptor-like protein kinase [Acorus calamus]|uniref:Receptor-like protein kinase n=1 Tax=Acorus calamus TaxID=4465 RepID=A0AAV9CMS8_ACOCL|nr:Receptor-like protein kinase [Acorus calamus]
MAQSTTCGSSCPLKPVSNNHEESQNAYSSHPIPSLIELASGGSIVPASSTFCNERRNNSLHLDDWRFTYANIERMTRNFETSIGKGGFGTVYLGYKDNGARVAVKILSQTSQQGTQEFRNEIEVLMKVQHKNLVPFTGYCDDGLNKALVYEYQLTQTLNEKSDVYSYGVVLYELITCKPAIIKNLTPAPLHVTNWVCGKSDINDVADPRLEGKYHRMSLEKAIQIAKKCTSPAPTSRPTMSIVVSGLSVCLDIEKAHRTSQNFDDSRSSSVDFSTPSSTI